MSKTVVNLTLPLIVEEIESVLDHHHYHPYRQAYATPELRQRLIAHVLNTVPACYAMVEYSQGENFPDPHVVPRNLRHKLHAAVINGIEQLIEENADWVSHHIPQETNPGYAPSCWFG